MHPPAKAWAVLARQFRNAVLILLLVTALISFVLGDRTNALIIGMILTLSRARIRRRVPRHPSRRRPALDDHYMGGNPLDAALTCLLMGGQHGLVVARRAQP
jgi:hypothetical protein